MWESESIFYFIHLKAKFCVEKKPLIHAVSLNCMEVSGITKEIMTSPLFKNSVLSQTETVCYTISINRMEKLV